MSENPDQPTLDDDTVLEHLRHNTDFFVRHQAILSELDLPHASGQAVSLIERQVEILRERNVTMRRRMNELLQAARTNDELFAKTRSLNLALLEVGSWHELNEVLATHVLVDFEADFVCCHVEQGGAGIALDHIRNHATDIPFRHLITTDAPVCSTLREEELGMVFPHADQTGTGSAVLLPLALYNGEGILCIGSRDPKRFAQDMDTLFVRYIADILAKVMNRLSSQ
jgi:uncharacterized protein YigA (DUF484 family)